MWFLIGLLVGLFVPFVVWVSFVRTAPNQKKGKTIRFYFTALVMGLTEPLKWRILGKLTDELQILDEQLERTERTEIYKRMLINQQIVTLWKVYEMTEKTMNGEN